MDNREEGASKKLVTHDPVAQKKLRQLTEQMDELMEMLSIKTADKIEILNERTSRSTQELFETK